MAKKTKKKFFSEERNSRLLAIILLSIIFPAMVFIVAPFEIYCNNIDELMFSATEFIGNQLLWTVALGAVLFAVLYFIPHCVYRYLYPFLIGLALMLFLQTNYLNGALSSLAGDGMGGEEISTATYIWNAILWIVIIGGIITAYQFIKIRSWTKLGALVITFILVATQGMNFTVTAINTADAFNPAIERRYGKYEDSPRFLTFKGVEEFAQDRNVILICIDRLDGEKFAEKAMDKYPEIKEYYDGFTYYNDAVSMYAYTFPSVAYMLSGQTYDHGDHQEYFNNVYHNNETISVLHENGYNVRLYAESYYDYTNANDLPDYVENAVETTKDSIKTVVRRPFRFSWALTQLGLYRSLPFFGKDLIGSMNSDTCNGYILYKSDELQGENFYEYENSDVKKELSARENDFKMSGDKNFTFWHVSGCHSKVNGSYIDSAKESLEMVGQYLTKFRTLDPEAYKNSTIIIMADHGEVVNRLKKPNKPLLSGTFVKPAGVSGNELDFSNAPISMKNLWATIFESEGIAYDKATFGDSWMKIQAQFEEDGIYPNREYVWLERRANLSEYDAFLYNITGSARDMKNWHLDESKTVHVDHPLFAN